MGRPIVLGPDDVRAFPDAPAGFNTRRAGVPAGVPHIWNVDDEGHTPKTWAATSITSRSGFSADIDNSISVRQVVGSDSASMVSGLRAFVPEACRQFLPPTAAPIFDVGRNDCIGA
jgi:hypothetical protein